MTTTLAKEEDGIKKGRARIVFVITDNSSQKRKTPPRSSNDQRLSFKKKNVGAKKNVPGVAATSNEANSGGFKGKYNFCHKFGHKKVDCGKLKAYLEKKGNPSIKVCLEYNIIDVLTNSW